MIIVLIYLSFIFDVLNSESLTMHVIRWLSNIWNINYCSCPQFAHSYNVHHNIILLRFRNIWTIFSRSWMRINCHRYCLQSNYNSIKISFVFTFLTIHTLLHTVSLVLDLFCRDQVAGKKELSPVGVHCVTFSCQNCVPEEQSCDD